MTTLFIFAHQDDEFGVFHEIADTLARGERPICVYLTNGAWDGVAPEERNAESTTVLTRLGVRSEDIKFLGAEFGIPDGSLVEHLDRSLDNVLTSVHPLDDIARVVVPAWEGGHHDHDAAHLVGLALACRQNVLGGSHQYPFYRAPALKFLLSFAAPLDANGPVISRTLGWRERLNYMGLLRHYRSQWLVMLKLAPLLAWSYVTHGAQKLQGLRPERAFEVPMSRPLLYETWGLYTYERFQTHADPFIAQHIASTIRFESREQAQSHAEPGPMKYN